MDDGARTNAATDTRTTHRHTGADANTGRNLPALIDADADAHWPTARTHTHVHVATRAHANAQRNPRRDGHTDTDTGGAASQQQAA